MSRNNENRVTGRPLLTKEDLPNISDEELIRMSEQAKGHTGKDFKKFMNCDFSYSVLIAEMKRRGMVNGWHIPGSTPSAKPERITAKKDKTIEYTRITLTVDKQTAADWRAFTENMAFNSVVTSCALQRLMRDVKSGHVTFVLSVNHDDVSNSDS